MGMESGSCISSGCGFLSETALAFPTACRSSTTEELLSKEQMVTAHSLQVTVQKEHQPCSNAFPKQFPIHMHTQPKRIFFDLGILGLPVGFIILSLPIFKKYCPFQAI